MPPRAALGASRCPAPPHGAAGTDTNLRVSTVSWMGMKPTGKVSFMSMSFISTKTLPKWLFEERKETVSDYDVIQFKPSFYPLLSPRVPCHRIWPLRNRRGDTTATPGPVLPQKLQRLNRKYQAAFGIHRFSRLIHSCTPGSSEEEPNSSFLKARQLRVPAPAPHPLHR